MDAKIERKFKRVALVIVTTYTLFMLLNIVLMLSGFYGWLLS